MKEKLKAKEGQIKSDYKTSYVIKAFEEYRRRNIQNVGSDMLNRIVLRDTMQFLDILEDTRKEAEEPKSKSWFSRLTGR